MKPVFSKTTEKFLLVAKLSDDRMKLFVDIDPIPPPAATPPPQSEGASEPAPDPSPPPPPAQWQPPPVTRDEILSVIKEFTGVEYVNVGVIDDIAAHLSKGEKVEERRIVKGEEAQSGADGKLLFLVKRFTGEGEVSINERGFADFHALHMFDNITKGTAVARIYPPKNGVDGRDALGKAIPAKPGKPVKPSLDRTLTSKRSDDQNDSYDVILADCDGYLCDDQGKLSIRTEFVVSGDLDFHLGIIDFVGSVRIKGDVLPGFSIKANRGIIVGGSVREASLVSPQGDITIEGHIYGGENARVVCGKNLNCVVAQELDAEVVGNITIKKEAVDCKLRTQSALIMEEGSLVGGRTLSVCGVAAKFVGNEASAETKIELCSDVEMTAEYMQLLGNIRAHEKALKLIELHLGPYSANPARIEMLSGQYRQKMQRLHEKKLEILKSELRLKEKQKEMLQKAHTNSVMRVNFLSKMFEGVVISVGEDHYSPAEILEGPASLDYVPQEHCFKVGELKGLECTVHSNSGEKID